MTDSLPYTKIESTGSGPIIFGKDVSQIPCFKNSWLYGITAGIFGGLMTFMGTSKPQLATKSSVVYLIGTTTAYWIYCRYQWMQDMKSTRMIQEFIRQQNEEGISIPVRPPDPSEQELEVVTVSNKGT